MTDKEKIKQLHDDLTQLRAKLTVLKEQEYQMGCELAKLKCQFRVNDIVSDSWRKYIIDEIYLYRDFEVAVKGRVIRINGEPENKESCRLHGYNSLPERWTLVKRGE